MSTSAPLPESGFRTPREDALRQRVAVLAAEKRQLLRQRRLHLVLLGLAVSLPFHIAILVWLSTMHKTLPPAGVPTAVVLDLAVLPNEHLEEMLDALQSEDLLTPEPLVDGGEAFEAEELMLEADLPAVELAAGEGGALTTVGGRESGEGLGSGLGTGTGAGANFFGIEAGGSRIAYIVDVSGSMRNNNRMVIAMAELKRSLRALPDYAAFMVVLYNEQPVIAPFQRGWLRASSSNIRRMEHWIDSISPGQGTHPIPAFGHIFSLDTRPDSIFFMTDGLIPPDTVPSVSAMNGGGAHVQINCIAFGQEATQGSLRRLAAESDGIFRFVPVGGGRP